MTYKDALEYIHSLRWKGKKAGLSKTWEMLELLGHPEKKLRFVHVAGTNGKGSVSVMLATVLKEAGYRTGLFTSPYIIRFNERIQVDLEEISDQELAYYTEQVKKVIEGMEEPPSEFEVVTVIAFLYYVHRKCDIVVLETGLGGTYDSTNVIPKALVTVITAIDFDHMAQLGNTMEEIAMAKAGIIKENGTVVFYGENDIAKKVIQRICREKNNRLTIPDFTSVTEHSADLFGQIFSYQEYDTVKLALAGSYQKKNAVLVLETLKELKRLSYQIAREQIYEGLKKARWMARFELLQTNPYVLLDGSHNPQGMKATMETVRRVSGGNSVRCIFGVMADKDISAMAGELLLTVQEVVAVTPEYPRAMEAKELYERLKEEKSRLNAKTQLNFCQTVADGLRLLLAKSEKNEFLLAIGSLYMAGEVKNFFSKQ